MEFGNDIYYLIGCMVKNMWIYDPDRVCRKCGCSEYPFYAKQVGKYFSIHCVCMLCKREDENLRQMEAWPKRHKKSVEYHKKWIDKNRKKYNAYMRAYYKKNNNRYNEVDNIYLTEKL